MKSFQKLREDMGGSSAPGTTTANIPNPAQTMQGPSSGIHKRKNKKYKKRIRSEYDTGIFSE